MFKLFLYIFIKMGGFCEKTSLFFHFFTYSIILFFEKIENKVKYRADYLFIRGCKSEAVYVVQLL